MQPFTLDQIRTQAGLGANQGGKAGVSASSYLAPQGGIIGTPTNTNPSTGRTLPTPSSPATASTAQFQSVTPQDNSAGIQNFNIALMNLLKQNQQMGTAGFARQGFDAQEAQVQRVQNTDPGLIGANPNVQNVARSADANALNPTIQSAQNSAQTFGEQLRNFGSAIDSARAFGKDYEDTLARQSDNAKLVVNQILTSTDPNALAQLQPDELANLEKVAGYPKGFVAQAVAFKQQQAQKELENQLAQIKAEQDYKNATLQQNQSQFNQKLLQDQSQFNQSLALDKQKLATTVNPQGQSVSSVTGKPLTDTERQAQGYASRLVASDQIIQKLGGQFTGAQSVFGSLAPNVFQSPERQQYEQAKTDFINAVLRKESGAAISPSEFSSADKQYFPQAGNSQAVVDQKATNRQLKIQALQLEGGMSQPKTYTVGNTVYVQAADGLYYPQ